MHAGINFEENDPPEAFKMVRTSVWPGLIDTKALNTPRKQQKRLVEKLESWQDNGTIHLKP